MFHQNKETTVHVLELFEVAENLKILVDDLYDEWDKRTGQKEPAFLKSEVLQRVENSVNHLAKVEETSSGTAFPKETKEYMVWFVLKDLKNIGMLKDSEDDPIATPTFIH